MCSIKAIFIFSLAVFLIVSLSQAAFTSEKDYPNRPIDLIATYPPGGPVDITTRLIQPPLQDALGVPVIVTNKGGVGGAIGTDFVAKAKPDGYTLGVLANSSFTSGPAINPALTYKYTDLVYICLLAIDYEAIVTRVDAPWKNLDDMISYAKKNPGKLTYGTPGYGSVAFFEMELFKLAHGLDIVPVHFQGSNPAMTAVLGGHVDLSIGGIGATASQIRAGKVIPLVVSSEKRLPAFPDVPTMSERGVKEAVNIWMPLAATQKCPKEVVEKLSRLMEKIMKTPAVMSQFEKAGLMVDYRDTAATSKLVEDEINAITKVVKKLGIGK